MFCPKDRAQEDLRTSVEVEVRANGCGERGQRRPDRAGPEAGGETPGAVRHAQLEVVQRDE